MCGASSSINGKISEIISEVLEATCRCLETDEVISSEEMLSFIDDLNEVLRREGAPDMGLCVGSLDVKALYPSLAIDACAKIAHDRILKSGIEFRDISTKWATIYLALNMKTHEIVRADLQHLIPTRRAKSGKPPTVLTIEVDQKNRKRNEEQREKGQEETPGRWKWFSDPEKATLDEN